VKHQYQISTRLRIHTDINRPPWLDTLYRLWVACATNDEAYQTAEALVKLRRAAGLGGIVVAYMPQSQFRSYEVFPSVWIPKKEIKEHRKRKSR
jgi:ABC-type antimicrobial peptide transport system permease subunit